MVKKNANAPATRMTHESRASHYDHMIVFSRDHTRDHLEIGRALLLLVRNGDLELDVNAHLKMDA